MIRKDLKDTEVKEDERYEEATRSRANWRATCRLGMERHAEDQVGQSSAAATEVECEVCSTKFRRESDKERHKCLSERNKPVSEQRGAASVRLAESGLGAGAVWLSRHAGHRGAEGHLGNEHKTCCPLVGLRDRKTAAIKQDTTGVCVCVVTG